MMPQITPSMPALNYLVDACHDLWLDVRPDGRSPDRHTLRLRGPSGERIGVDLRRQDIPLVEQVIRGVSFDFASLPLLVRGDSKEIRLLTPKIALARLLPSVYSFTYNRYGAAPHTDVVRARFSAHVFRKMAAYPGPAHLSTAFLGLVESPQGPLLAEEVVQTCNLEVRVKRYHVGSPLHRYRFTEQHPTARGGKPLRRWSRFERPVVCFDWRHPMRDEQGERLSDEPLPDDYAAQWIDDLPGAKQLARRAFEWLEALFAQANLQLIDICFFIDRTGRVLYGEISPDCMRVRSNAATDAESFDKDVWRSGGAPEEVVQRYRLLHQRIFGAETA